MSIWNQTDADFVAMGISKSRIADMHSHRTTDLATVAVADDESDQIPTADLMQPEAQPGDDTIAASVGLAIAAEEAVPFQLAAYAMREFGECQSAETVQQLADICASTHCPAAHHQSRLHISMFAP